MEKRKEKIIDEKIQDNTSTFEGERLHGESLRNRGYEQKNTGTKEELLSDEFTSKLVRKYLQSKRDKITIFSIWEANYVTILAEKESEIYTIRLLTETIEN